MPIESGMDLLMSLLYAPGQSGEYGEEIRGITKLEKLIFLLLKEGGFEDKMREEYQYEAYDFGPYSREVYDYLETLKSKNLIEVKREKYESFKEVVDEIAILKGQVEFITEEITVNIYSLNERGKKIGKWLLEKKLTDEEFQKIIEIKKKYNKLDLNSLLKYVYSNYPESTKKSKIFNTILGYGRRPELTSFSREE